METRSTPDDGFHHHRGASSRRRCSLVAFLGARPAVRERGHRVSGNTRMRVVAAQLASSAIENGPGPAADPSKFTTIVAPGTTVTTKTVNGLKFTITQEMQWVGQSSTTSACDSGGVGEQRDPAGHRVGDVDGHGRRPQPVRGDDDARAAGRRVLGGDRIDRREGAQRGRRCRRRTSRCQVAGPDRPQSQQTTTRGVRVLRVPRRRARTRCRSPRAPASATRSSSCRARSTSVTVGQTASMHVQLRHRGDDHRHRLDRLGRDARDRHPDRRSRTRACSRTAQYSYAAGHDVADAAVPVPERLHGVRRQLHRQQPARHGHQPQPRSTDSPRHGRRSNVDAGRDATATRAAVRPAGQGRRTASACRSAGATLTATDDDDVPAPVHVGVHERRRRRGTAPTLGLVTTDAAGMQHDRGAARSLDDHRHVGHEDRHGRRSGAASTGVFNVDERRGASRPAPRTAPVTVTVIVSALPTPLAARRREPRSGYTLIEMMIAMSAAVGRRRGRVRRRSSVMQRPGGGHDRPVHRRGRGADHRRPHHEGPARRGRGVERPAPRSRRPT